MIEALTMPAILLALAISGALALYGVSAMIWTVVLSKLDLSLAYPMVSMGYVLVVFLSWLILKEPVSLLRIAGLAVICCGVLLISRS